MTIVIIFSSTLALKKEYNVITLVQHLSLYLLSNVYDLNFVMQVFLLVCLLFGKIIGFRLFCI